VAVEIKHPARLFCTAIWRLISVTPAGKIGSCSCGMLLSYPTAARSASTARNHSVFTARQNSRARSGDLKVPSKSPGRSLPGRIRVGELVRGRLPVSAIPGAIEPGPRYFNLEKSVGSMKTDSGDLARILPFFSDSAETFLPFRIGPERRQFFLAASMLGAPRCRLAWSWIFPHPAEPSSPRSRYRGAGRFRSCGRGSAPSEFPACLHCRCRCAIRRRGFARRRNRREARRDQVNVS